MRCQHCGQDIEQGQVFCGYCGESCVPQTEAESTTDTAATPVSPVPQQDAPAPVQAAATKKPSRAGRIILTILGILWLLGALAAWGVFIIVMLFFGTANFLEKPKAVLAGDEQEVVTVYADIDGSLTDYTWYQPLMDGDMYVWTFRSNGTAQYSVVGSQEKTTVPYTKDGAVVVIGDYQAPLFAWEYDSLEKCYWQYSYIDNTAYKTRVFAADAAPDYPNDVYHYRADSAKVTIPYSYEAITELNQETAQELLDRYCAFTIYGTCQDMHTIEDAEKYAVLRAGGFTSSEQMLYHPYKLSCCTTVAMMERHLAHYLGENLLRRDYFEEAPSLAWNGAVYPIAVPRGNPFYYAEASVTEHADGTWTVPVKIMSEGDESNIIAVFTKQNGSFILSGFR